jgi:alginate O-acetyltransferase complex protein AlgJ
MKTDPSRIVFIALGLAWLAASAAINLETVTPAKSSAVELPRLTAVLDGSASSAFDAEYRKELFFNDTSRTVFGVLRYAAFGEGRSGVVVGNEGWLFSKEELERPADYKKRIEAGFSEIAAAANALQSRGISLTIALIPQKTDIYSDKLASPLPTSDQTLMYEEARARIVALGIAAPDLRVPLLEARTQQPVFLRTDTHWTPYGALIAAKTISSSLGINTGSPTSNLVNATPVAVTGDLRKFLALGPFAASAGYSEETVVSLSAPVESQNLGTDIFADAAPSIVLIGTSYSANELWSFAEVLKYELGQDVLNLAEQGKGPFEPMSAFLKTLPSLNPVPRQIIWEIPLRYFVVTPAPSGADPHNAAHVHSQLSAKGDL